MELPPPRYGNHNGNVELAIGAKHPVCGNPHFEYYRSLIDKQKTPTNKEGASTQELEHLTTDAYIRLPFH